MFKIFVRPTGNERLGQTHCLYESVDVRDFILTLTKSKKEAELAFDWCNNAHFKDKVVRPHYNYKIDCVDEAVLLEDFRKVVRVICAKTNLTSKESGHGGYRHNLYYNNVPTGEIWYDYNFGYYVDVHAPETVTYGYVKHLFSITLTDKRAFIDTSIKGINKALQDYTLHRKVTVNDKLTGKQIADRVIMVFRMQAAGDPQFREYHSTVYYDGIWKIDLEIFAISGVVRWWVSREDKAGNYQNSLFTMYRSADTGQLKYSADYHIKKEVVRRLLTAFEILEKFGIQA